jgi:cephalosporin hydroxylase
MIMSRLALRSDDRLLPSQQILLAMRKVQGWLDDSEAELLMAAAVNGLNSAPPGSAIVEVGSFCGRSTIVLGSVVKALGAKTKVYAVDPHEGVVGSVDQGIELFPPTLATLRHNIAANGLSEAVEIIAKCSFEVVWIKPICFLLIDGLHDYPNVARDFRHFEPWLLPGALIAFHDYDQQHPGVQDLVGELLMTPKYRQVDSAGSMIVVRFDCEQEKTESMRRVH